MTVSIIKYSKHKELRGENYTIYDKTLFNENFCLDKISVSYKGVIRGFHGDNCTNKLISVLYGSIKLITYDLKNHIREEFIISDMDDEAITILVPPYHLNAHQCLSDRCVFYYKWDQPYDLKNQYSVIYNDKTINPNWINIDPIISDRDLNSGSLNELINSIS